MLVVLGLAALAGCGDQVDVAVPELDADGRARCETLVDDLPEALLGGERREVSPADAPAAAWGDPAVVLVCGAPVPEEYDEFSACTEVGGVGWFIPDSQLVDAGADVEMTALSHSPHVQVTIPAERRSRGSDAVLTSLGPLLREHLRATSPCH